MSQVPTLSKSLAATAKQMKPRTNSSNSDESVFSSTIVPYFRSVVNSVDRKTLYIGLGAAAATTMAAGVVAWYIYNLKYKTGKKQKGSVSFDLNENNMEDPSKYGVLILHQCPRGRKTPCIAPYPLKLETFLRVHSIKYEVDFNNSDPQGKGTPWITLNLEDICDSHNCLKFICEKYGMDLEKGMSEHTISIARAYSHLLDNHLYWGIALHRWVYDGAKSLNDIQLLPPKTIKLIPDICRTVEQAAWFHGIGKKKQEEVVEAIQNDLKALSEFLGDKKFFLGGDKATELDCTAFAMLAQMMWNMEGSLFESSLKETYKNLGNFCWRMRIKYWMDWDKCLNNVGYSEDLTE